MSSNIKSKHVLISQYSPLNEVPVPCVELLGPFYPLPQPYHEMAVWCNQRQSAGGGPKQHRPQQTWHRQHFVIYIFTWALNSILSFTHRRAAINGIVLLNQVTFTPPIKTNLWLPITPLSSIMNTIWSSSHNVLIHPLHVTMCPNGFNTFRSTLPCKLPLPIHPDTSSFLIQYIHVTPTKVCTTTLSQAYSHAISLLHTTTPLVW